MKYHYCEYLGTMRQGTMFLYILMTDTMASQSGSLNTSSECKRRTTTHPQTEASTSRTRTWSFETNSRTCISRHPHSKMSLLKTFKSSTWPSTCAPSFTAHFTMWHRVKPISLSPLLSIPHSNLRTSFHRDSKVLCWKIQYSSIRIKGAMWTLISIIAKDWYSWRPLSVKSQFFLPLYSPRSCWTGLEECPSSVRLTWL